VAAQGGNFHRGQSYPEFEGTRPTGPVGWLLLYGHCCGAHGRLMEAPWNGTRQPVHSSVSEGAAGRCGSVTDGVCRVSGRRGHSASIRHRQSSVIATQSGGTAEIKPQRDRPAIFSSRISTNRAFPPLTSLPRPRPEPFPLVPHPHDRTLRATPMSPRTAIFAQCRT